MTLAGWTANSISLEARIAQIMVRESKDWSSTTSGAVTHKIDLETATTVTRLLLEAVVDYKVPIAFPLGAARRESRFDPKAINPNGHPGLIEKTDWGWGQLSGKNMLAMGLTPEVVLTPEWSVPATCRRLRELLDWAKPKYPGSDPFYVAAMAYNKGRTGTEIILSRKPRKGIKNYETFVQVLMQEFYGRAHARAVMGFTRQFKAELGLAEPVRRRRK